MALTDESGVGITMPVTPAAYSYGMPYGGNNGGLFGNGDSWLGILFLIALCNGGFGFGGGFGGGWGNGMLGYDFPWLMAGQQNINANTNGGFRDAMLNDGITSIRDGISGLSTQMCSGFGNVSTQLCNGFNGVTSAVNGAQNAIAQQMYTNQLADLERSFAAQTAITGGQRDIQSQLAQNGYNQAAGTADIKYTIATEACNTRAANTANTQAILDKLCALELDGYKRENDNLRTQLNMASLAASQAAQTATIQQGFASEVDAVYNRLKNCPVGTVPVFGNQPIFTCAQNVAGGCGCGA